MEILKGYGLGPNLQILLQQYWYKEKVVLKAGKYFEKTSRTERGVTKMDQVSSYSTL